MAVCSPPADLLSPFLQSRATLEKALLLSLDRTDEDSVVKLLIGFRAPIAKLNFQRLFETSEERRLTAARSFRINPDERLSAKAETSTHSRHSFFGGRRSSMGTDDVQARPPA